MPVGEGVLSAQGEALRWFALPVDFTPRADDRAGESLPLRRLLQTPVTARAAAIGEPLSPETTGGGADDVGVIATAGGGGVSAGDVTVDDGGGYDVDSDSAPFFGVMDQDDGDVGSVGEEQRAVERVQVGRDGDSVSAMHQDGTGEYASHLGRHAVDLCDYQRIHSGVGANRHTSRTLAACVRAFD